MTEGYKEQLKYKMDIFVHEIFKAGRLFPREEIYITTSQLKRAALSVILNYVEGYARFKKGNQLNFLEIAYGSLKEVKYLIYFSYQEKFLSQEIYDKLNAKAEELGAMLWTEIAALNRSLDN